MGISIIADGVNQPHFTFMCVRWKWQGLITVNSVLYLRALIERYCSIYFANRTVKLEEHFCFFSSRHFSDSGFWGFFPPAALTSLLVSMINWKTNWFLCLAHAAVSSRNCPLQRHMHAIKSKLASPWEALIHSLLIIIISLFPLLPLIDWGLADNNNPCYPN
jgi:hypothetical protein